MDVYLALYVDDGLLMCRSLEIIDKILKEFRSCFEITIGDGSCFCGLEISYPADNEIFVSQTAYVNRVVEKFNMSNSKTSSVPFNPGSPLHSGQCSSNEEMFIATVSRPDIMYAVSQVSRFFK